VLGECEGQPMNCNDGDPCTVNTCVPATGCVSEPASGPTCVDGSACTEADACIDGQCVGTPVSCDDGNPCTKDGCDPETGCTHAPLIGDPCDDSSVCTKEDHCDKGQCKGTAVKCDDGSPCTEDLCDPLEGCVHSPATGTWCNDGNACTDLDQCVEGVCMGQATACGDGNPCTLDSCTVEGGCIHTQPPGLPCDDGSACTLNDKCYQGACVPGKPPNCNDMNACTEDWCDPAVGCVHDALSNVGCDDADACTAGDLCVKGECVGDAVTCNDANPCTSDTCVPAVGCVFPPLSAPCDDNDPCTDGDYCDGGTCQPGKNPECLAVDRVVLAGDSWSAGLIFPLRDALDDRGFEEVVVSWELTAKPGSTVAEWISKPDYMLALAVALDMEPKADILFFTLTGNDYLHLAKSGLGLMGALEWFFAMTLIQMDLQAFVAMVQAGRPDLKIVLVGYDYLQFDLLALYGGSFPGFDRIKCNLGLVDLASRGRAVAASVPNMVYAHNMGILQYTFGDHFNPLLPCPFPPIFPEYGPGEVPKPGPAPGYDPFPGGWWAYPSPADHIPDGLHPDYAGFRTIIENSLDQGPAAWIEGKPWP
jgi:hypothetical protein